VEKKRRNLESRGVLIFFSVEDWMFRFFIFFLYNKNIFFIFRVNKNLRVFGIDVEFVFVNI